MKHPSSSPRSYLHQLAAPLPQSTALLHARRPIARAASVPPIVDSVDSIESFAGHSGVADLPAAVFSVHNASPETMHVAPPSVLSSIDSTKLLPGAKDQGITLPVAAGSVAARPVTTSRRAEDAPQQGAPRRDLSERSAPIGEDAPHPSTRLEPEPAPELSTTPLRPLFAESSSTRLTSSSASRAEAKRGRGIQVHIGTVEVRVAAPSQNPPQPPANKRREPDSSHSSRSTHAEPLSRGLAWSYGLVQG